MLQLDQRSSHRGVTGLPNSSSLLSPLSTTQAEILIGHRSHSGATSGRSNRVCECSDAGYARHRSGPGAYATRPDEVMSPSFASVRLQTHISLHELTF